MTTENTTIIDQNTTATKCTSFDDVTLETLLKDTPNWERLTKSLESYITDLGNKKIDELFSEGKVKNQPFAILLHTSAGAVGDKFANAKTKDERFKILLKLLRGKLTEEEEKREKELIKQKAVIDTLRPIWGFLPESEKMKYSELIRSELGK